MIDRALQRKILFKAKSVYPNGIKNPADEFHDPSDQKLWANIKYLMEHGLLDGLDAGTLGQPIRYINLKITAAGIDFLEDDGGLSAILGTITVRFAEDQFREMLICRAENIEGPIGTKREFISAIKSLPASALKAVALRAVMTGLESIPSIDAFQKWLSSG